MAGPSGYFEHFVNERTDRISEADRRLIGAVNAVAQPTLGGTAHWAGSRAKGTAVAHSDLDLCLDTPAPVTVGQRRDLAKALQRALSRPAHPRSHVIRLNAHAGQPKVDLAFACAAFGDRPLPDKAPFTAYPGRRVATRALKLWGRQPGFPPFPGWAIEALVIFRDAPAGHDGLTLFRRVTDWLADSASAPAVEGVLRPAAAPAWRPEWSKPLPGRVEALAGRVRQLRRAAPQPEAWASSADVARWLGCG